MKGLLGSMCSTADKLPMFCGPVFLWLLSNSGQNFDNPWMQVIIPGSLMLCFISFILLAFTSKFKERESIDGVLFKISIWLMLPVFFALWPGLCMIMHLFAHTSIFILWPLGALFSIISVSFWYLSFYKELQKILEELKGLCVPENVVLPENPESEAASDKGLHWGRDFMVGLLTLLFRDCRIIHILCKSLAHRSYRHMHCPSVMWRFTLPRSVLRELGS